MKLVTIDSEWYLPLYALLLRITVKMPGHDHSTQACYKPGDLFSHKNALNWLCPVLDTDADIMHTL